MPKLKNRTPVVSDELPAETWNVEDVKKFLQVSRTTIHNLMKYEGLPFIKLGRSVRFDPRDVGKWWNERRLSA